MDERPLHNRHDASNVTVASVGVRRTSPSRPSPPSNVTLTTAEDHRPSTVSTATTVPITPRSDPGPGHFVAPGPPGSAEAAGDGRDVPLSQAHQLHRRRSNTIAKAPLPVRAPATRRHS